MSFYGTAMFHCAVDKPELDKMMARDFPLSISDYMEGFPQGLAPEEVAKRMDEELLGLHVFLRIRLAWSHDQRAFLVRFCWPPKIGRNKSWLVRYNDGAPDLQNKDPKAWFYAVLHANHRLVAMESPFSETLPLLGINLVLVESLVPHPSRGVEPDCPECQRRMAQS